MHEISIAKGILDRALDVAEEHGADRIDELTLEIGRVTHVNPEQLEFCLAAITDSTLAADATIWTEPVEPVAACDCGWRDTPEELELAGGFAPDIKCPVCGSRAELVAGRECRLSSIEVPEQTAMDRPATRAENPQ